MKLKKVKSHSELINMVSVGRVSFTPAQLVDNANELLHTLNRMKPSSAKGTYMKSITIASTMSPGVKIDTRSIK